MKSLKRKVRRLDDKLWDNVNDAVRNGAVQAASSARQNVLTGGQVWKGNLAGSIYMRTDASTRPMSTYRVVADVPYAAFVEFGTGPRGDPSAPPKFQFGTPNHTPELTASIMSWVMTKPMFFGPRTPGVAWGIAKTISAIGTNPHPYMRPAWHAAKHQLIREARLGVKRAVRRV